MVCKIYIILLLLLIQGIFSDGLRAQSRELDLQEKVILSINKSFFLSGEKILCSVYTRDAWLHKPLDISKVVSIEVLDESDRPLIREKCIMKNGKGAAIISLPGSMASGIYTIRAYTNWMRNHDPSHYYHCNFTVIDPQRIIYTDPAEPGYPLKISFFPEGGRIVSGLENHVVIKASDSFGRPVPGSGWLIKGSGDTLRQLEFNTDGFADVLFSPQKDTAYSLSIHDQKWRLPESENEGWVLNVDPFSRSHVRIEIQKNRSIRDTATLSLHRRGVLLYSILLPAFESRYRLEIGATEMNGGVGNLQIVDQSGHLLAQRLVQLPENRQYDVGVAVNRSEFEQREEAELTITTSAAFSDVSVVVQMENIELIPGISTPDMLRYHTDVGTYLPLCSESKDLHLIEFGGTDRDRGQIWRENGIEFMPEIRGRMIAGHFVNGNGTSFRQEELILARVSSESELSDFDVTDEGRFFLHPKAITADQEYVLLQKSGKSHSLLLDDGFSDQFAKIDRPRFILGEEIRLHLERNMVHQQLQQMYETEPQFKLQKEAKFYGSADEVIVFSDYVKLPVMEEFFRELTKSVILTREDGVLKINVLDKYRNRIIGADPMYLLDGVPVFDTETVLLLDPGSVKKISIKASRYFYGGLMMDGIVDIETFKGDFSSLKLPENASVHLFNPAVSLPETMHQRYSKTDSSQTFPDLRTTLCWKPVLETDQSGKATVTFYTSDIPGTYVIKLTAFSKEGSLEETTETIVVK